MPTPPHAQPSPPLPLHHLSPYPPSSSPQARPPALRTARPSGEQNFERTKTLSKAEEQRLAAAAKDYLQLQSVVDLVGGMMQRPPSMAELAAVLQMEEGWVGTGGWGGVGGGGGWDGGVGVSCVRMSRVHVVGELLGGGTPHSATAGARTLRGDLPARLPTALVLPAPALPGCLADTPAPFLSGRLAD